MSDLAPDHAAIQQFLAQVGGAAIQLVTFPAAGGPSQARWFGADAASAAAWAVDRNAAGANIYYSVNVVRAGLNKKASKGEVTLIRYAQVDIDPPKGDATFDKVAAMSILLNAEVPPHIVVDSGGGVQALWRVDGLDKPAVESINRSLIARFGGDPACSDSSRILRVPGTINLPNVNKRNAGRVAAAAVLLSITDGHTTAAELTMAYGPAPTRDRSEVASEVALVGGLASLDALGIGLADPLRQLLTDPAGDDRSDDTYAAACEMHRRGFDADQMAAVLLDPGLRISAHCLAQSNPERAAHRAIERAQAAVLADDDAFEVLANAKRAASAISATPFAWPAAHTIPPRRWLYGRDLQYGNVCVIVAPGATGKTALTVGMALAMTSGKPLLGHDVHGGPKRVWLYNLEDDLDELTRSFSAAAWAHDIDPVRNVSDRLFIDSGVSGPGLCTAKQVRHGFTVLEPVYAALKAEIIARRIDCLIVDPFVSSHQVNENDNGAIDAVAKEWAKVAVAADCVIVLVHHTSKAAGAEVTVNRARGASALPNAARSVLVLNRMTEEEAPRWGIEPGDARRYFRVYNDKSNRAPAATEADWYEIVSVDLPNGEGDDWIGDSVGAVTRWYPPTVGPREPLARDTTAQVQALIAQGEWRESERAERWAGKPIAQILELDVDDKAQRVRIRSVLKELLAIGALRKEERRDATRQMRTWIVDGTLPSVQSAKSASIPAVEDASLNAPMVQPADAMVHEGSQAVHRTSQIPLGIDWSGAERAAAARIKKSSCAKRLAKRACASLGQDPAALVAGNMSECL